MFKLKINWEACQPIEIEILNQEEVAKYLQQNEVTKEEMAQIIAMYDAKGRLNGMPQR